MLLHAQTELLGLFHNLNRRKIMKTYN